MQIKHQYKAAFVAGMLFFSTKLLAQVDSIRVKDLDSIRITSILRTPLLQTLPDVKGTYLYAGKKTEVINLSRLDVNRVNNNPRQIFGKVPGVFVYENDGSGNQVNISSRALDPHRSWELNVRHNDAMINSDLYGYPAAHFNAPMESVERIEIVRGSGALQYGAQFGGMMNYVTKEGDSTRPFSFETKNAAGTNGLFSTFNAVGGTKGKVQYYAYANYRRSDGWRDNSGYNYFAGHVHLNYQISNRLRLRVEYNYMDYVNHVNGGLTDAQFAVNPQQSTRNRNYYSPTIHVPMIRLDYDINPSTQVNFISSAVLGSRNSVQFIALSTVADTINAATGEYNPRQVDRDFYHSYSNEVRLRKNYNLRGLQHTLVTGLRYINNDLNRKQLGKGTTGADYDLSLTDPNWGRDMHFKTQNLSVFAENLFRITPALTLTAGARGEFGDTKMTGYIYNYDPEKIPVDISHKFVLLGFGGEYRLKNGWNAFANWTQSYRPVVFADIIPASSLIRIDPNIKDAHGHTSELGIRGKSGNFFDFNLTLFNVRYNNRVGSVVLTDNTGTYTYKTNTGNSRATGFELYAEFQPIRWLIRQKSKYKLSVFTSTAYIHARYLSGSSVSGGVNKDISGNRVQVSPEWITKNGITAGYKGFSTTFQFTYTGDAYADALNTREPNAPGTVGLVPSYGIFDWNFTYVFRKYVTLNLLMNNIFDKHYFTERPWFFPGPGGIYPSDGRSVILSVGVAL
ncbi:TonB-dependent receptor family protein [Pollutibacter soli]|uniref:TonB-dependent receptor family protein n=1 Tax=Pollutibacter soli TaxID=3034157 RepID=UPI003013BF0A